MEFQDPEPDLITLTKKVRLTRPNIQIYNVVE